MDCYWVSWKINHSSPGHARAEGAEKRTAERGQAGAGGKWFSVLVPGHGFSKYSGKVVSAGRNRPRFAIRAHCGLLVTSVSPNCCFLAGILRKSHFPAQRQRKTIPSPSRCLPRPSPPSFARLPLLPSIPPPFQTGKIHFCTSPYISAYFRVLQ